MATYQKLGKGYLPAWNGVFGDEEYWSGGGARTFEIDRGI